MSHGVKKRMIQVFITFLIMAVILFITAGRLDWYWAWAYLGVGLVILIVNASVLPPELIAERGQPGTGAKNWDRILTSVTGIPIVAVYIIAGLDERYDWSPQLAPVVHILGLIAYTLGQCLFTWAMKENKFFSTAVRLQFDRGQTVAVGGPYRYIRHPGYAGFIASYFATAIALGSLWAVIPAIMTTCLMILRTALEDSTLQEELPGYSEYSLKVRYRLLPGFW